MITSHANRYTLLGILWGLCFPAAALVLLYVLGGKGAEVGWWRFLLRAHRQEPLLYLIDTAPLFLGLMARFAGTRQDRFLRLNARLEARIQEKTRSLRHALRDAQQANERIIYLADHDPLTDLLNRRSFRAELARWVGHASRYRRSGALIFIDLDNFKDINDRFGHHAGDHYLMGVAALLKKTLRNTDILARWGGDEFAVLLPEAGAQTAAEVASKLLALFREQPVLINGHTLYVSASLGIALYPLHTSDPDELEILADVAMYQSKQGGRNRWQIYAASAEEMALMHEEIRWEDRIRRALETDQFVLYYQPVLDLARHETREYEALLRLEDSNGQLYAPGQFLGIAERFQLDLPIDRMVIRKAAYKAAFLSSRGIDARLSLNLSPRGLADGTLPAFIQALLDEAGVDPAALGFEITAAGFDERRAFAIPLKALGCRLILDDFDPDAGALPGPEAPPIDAVKLRGELVRALPDDPSARDAVRALCAAARARGIIVVAKGVEEPGSLPLLRELGLDRAQGFALGKPMAAFEAP